jgi:hypothetical protein
MFIRMAQSQDYADLGDAWFRNQLARISQVDQQSGRHYRVDADALLRRLADNATAAKEKAELERGSSVRGRLDARMQERRATLDLL